MQKTFLYPLLLAATLAGAPAQAQKVKIKTKGTPAPAAAPATAPDWAATYAGSITPEDLRRHLTVLASDAYEGRETGEKGQKMAAEYLAQQFKALGLTGPVPNSDNPYLQHFPLERTVWATEQMKLQVGKQSFG